MASLIPGYSYDIFISYRQKDNKYDGWVTEFVENLKKELEATIKEEVSLYFDVNPHDGLLESHEVSDSLKNKLRCLIFIPILSTTYCDPNSFAWQHEFIEFIELAKSDRLGLKINLPGGNVASRVMPIRIHDLKKGDVHQFEEVIGGVLRGIEFIYQQSGVNRPLRSNEDHASENLNKTFYRDQINKVANSIRDLLSGIMLIENNVGEKSLVEEEGSKTSFITDIKKSSIPKSFGNYKKTMVASVLGLVILSIFFFFFLNRPKPTEILEKAISAIDPTGSWDYYSGKIKARSVWINGENEYNETFEINRSTNLYRRTIFQGTEKIIQGSENHRYFNEVYSNDNKLIKVSPEDSIDKGSIDYWKVRHTFHFGGIIVLKNSGLRLGKRTKFAQFYGTKCYEIEFKSDTTLNLSPVYKNTSWRVFVDRKDYYTKGYLVQMQGSTVITINSGKMTINNLILPMCKTYFSATDDSFMGVDVISRPDN